MEPGVNELPRWDMAELLSQTAPRGLAQASADLDAAIDELAEMFSQYGVGLMAPAHGVNSALADVDALLQAVATTFLAASDLEEILDCLTSADANALAARFGIDLRQPEFWQAGLRQLEDDVERFEVLVDRIAEL